jgi:hypothetical protein
MSSGTYEQVGNASDTSFQDPTGAYASALSGLQSYLSGINSSLEGVNSGSAVDQFLGQASGLANLVSGQNSALQQSLNALATQEAQQGGEAALAKMGSGLRNSGAAASAFGQAYATPFAEAQATLQGKQLDATTGLWQSALSSDTSSLASLLSAASQGQNTAAELAGQSSYVYTPQYEYQKGLLDYLSGAGESAANAGSATLAAQLAKILMGG